MKKFLFSLAFIFCISVFCFGENHRLLIDDFENSVSGGPQGTVDFGAGGGSSVGVEASIGIKYSGKQSLKVIFDAVSGGYMWVARGFGLDAKKAGWPINPQEIEWEEYNAVSFYMYGNSSHVKVAFDIKDRGNEMWRFLLEDNFTGWKQIVCPFNDFFARDDWQPDNADKNANLDFPIQSFQFEPRPEAKGVFYFDAVELIE